MEELHCVASIRARGASEKWSPEAQAVVLMWEMRHQWLERHVVSLRLLAIIIDLVHVIWAVDVRGGVATPDEAPSRGRKAVTGAVPSATAIACNCGGTCLCPRLGLGHDFSKCQFFGIHGATTTS